jgi:hypothetical protein
MRTIDDEEVSFQTIEDHIDHFDWPDVLSLHFEPCDRQQFLTNAFTLSRPILLALMATPLIPEGWQSAIDLLVVALDGVTGREGGGGGEVN